MYDLQVASQNLQVSSVSSQQKAIHANVKLADAMGKTAQTMAGINKRMDPAQIARNMQQFQKVATQLQITDDVGKFSNWLQNILTTSPLKE